MAVHYPFFCIRGVNWFAVDALYRPQITADTTDDQLFALIASALSLFNDAHLLLIDANTVNLVAQTIANFLFNTDFRGSLPILPRREHTHLPSISSEGGLAEPD